MIPEQITNHEDEALELLTGAFKEKAVIEGLVKVHARRMQALEDVIYQVMNGFLLDNAVGVQLDALGSIVKEPRRGRIDARYRKAIRVRIRVNRSKGRTIDMVAVVKLLDPDGKFIEYRYLNWLAEFYGTEYGGDYVTLLAQAKAQMSYGVVHVSSLPKSEIMRWDTRHGTSLGAGHKWSSAHG